MLDAAQPQPAPIQGPASVQGVPLQQVDTESEMLRGEQTRSCAER
jgi:hypothetical protein